MLFVVHMLCLEQLPVMGNNQWDIFPNIALQNYQTEIIQIIKLQDNAFLEEWFQIIFG